MKLAEMAVNPEQIRALCSCASIIEARFPNTEVSIKDGNIMFKVVGDLNAINEIMIGLEDKLNRDMACRCGIEHTENNFVLRMSPFWKDDMLHNRYAIRKTVFHATRNIIPFDENLNKQIKRINNFEYDHTMVDSGIGIWTNEFGHSIDFKVESVDPDCGLWIAYGSIDDYRVKLLAGSEAHAFAKIIKSFYRHEKQVDPLFAEQLYENKIPWFAYGYGY